MQLAVSYRADAFCDSLRFVHTRTDAVLRGAARHRSATQRILYEMSPLFPQKSLYDL